MANSAQSFPCVNTKLKQKARFADPVKSSIINPDGHKASDRLLIHKGFWQLGSIFFKFLLTSDRYPIIFRRIFFVNNLNWHKYC